MSNLAGLYQARSQWVDANALWQIYFRHSNAFLQQVLWGASESTRQTYIEQQSVRQNNALSFYLAHPELDTAAQALNFSLTRKGLLLQISSQIKALAKASNKPELKELASQLSSQKKQLAQHTECCKS